MHLALLWILGPLGLNHGTGVLIWNVFSLLLAPLLFFDSNEAPDEEASNVARMPTWGPRAASILLILAIAAPLGRTWGYWDQWTSWALYAPGGPRAELLVPAASARHLTAEAKAFLQPVDTTETWLRLRLDHWSLSATHSPIYPQARFQFAAARALAASRGIENSVRIVVFSQADVWTGHRESRILIGKAEFDAWDKQYWLNTKAHYDDPWAAKPANFR